MEDLASPLLRGQVLDICAMFARQEVDLTFVYFSRPEDAKPAGRLLRQALPDSVGLVVEPVGFLGWTARRLDWQFYRPVQGPLVIGRVVRTLKRLIERRASAVVHFRSYPIALAGVRLKSRRPNLRVVFDPRSPFPEEGVTLGRMKRGGRTHRYWQAVELRLLRGADAVVATSKAFGRSLLARVPSAGVHVIGNNVDTARFTSAAADRTRIRHELDIDPDAFVFGYVGSLGLRFWNDPNAYAGFMRSIAKSGRPACFLFVTRDQRVLRKVMAAHGIDERRHRVVGASFDEVPGYLACMDAGLNFMAQPDPRLSVKTVEYLAAGLAVVTNERASGVAGLVRDNELGVVVGDETALSTDEIERIFALFEARDEYASRAKSYALSECSTEAVSGRYLAIYRALWA